MTMTITADPRVSEFTHGALPRQMVQRAARAIRADQGGCLGGGTLTKCVDMTAGDCACARMASAAVTSAGVPELVAALRPFARWIMDCDANATSKQYGDACPLAYGPHGFADDKSATVGDLRRVVMALRRAGVELHVAEPPEFCAGAGEPRERQRSLGTELEDFFAEVRLMIFGVVGTLALAAAWVAAWVAVLVAALWLIKTLWRLV